MNFNLSKLTNGLLALILIPFIANAAVLEEVTVTAQKREQSIQDIGISVTAFTGDQLKAFGYTNAQQVTALAAGVSTVQPNGEANYSLAIRGSASSDFTSNNESPVALYVDEVYISQMSGAGFMLFDMERVEVLRGPQGTLYGRNATGGLASFITVKPSQEFGGYGKLSVGEHSQIKFEGAVGGGLADNVSARASISTHNNDGYARNRFLDQSLNNANDYAGRVQILLEPTEDFSFLLNGRYSQQEIRTGFFEHAVANTPQAYSPVGTVNNFADYIDSDLNNDKFTGDYDREGFNDMYTYGFTGTFNWSVGGVEVVSITDYSSVERDYIEDSDASPSPGFNFSLNTNAQQFSQELRVSGETDNYKWVAGFYLLDIDIADSNGGETDLFADAFLDAFGLLGNLLPTEIPFNIGCCQGLGTGTNRGFDSPYTIDTNSKSMFAQVEYEFNSQWTGIGGFRYIDEDKDYAYNNNVVRFVPGTTYRNGNPNIIANLVSFATSRSDSLWSAKVEVDYRPNDDLLLYASWNRGTKASGFNAPFLAVGGDPNDVLPYKPEELDAFEAGFKWTFAEGRARLNASAYYYDYQDYQAFDIIVLDTLTANRDAEMAGFELELQASPTDGLDILFGLAYNDAEVDMGGRKTRPVQSPKWNANGMIRYQWPMANGTMAIQGDIDYRSGTLFSLTGADTVNQGGYEVANARLSYTTSDDKWEAAVYVNNLLDEEYRVSQFDLSGNVLIDAGGVLSLVEQYYGRPRWVGGSISYNF